MKELVYTVIESEEQYKEYCSTLEILIESGLTEENSVQHFKLLSLLVEDWDKKHSRFADLDPVDVVKCMLEEHRLKPHDLTEITGYGKSYISEILNYKKRMPLKFIRMVANHFKLDESFLSKEYAIRELPRPKRVLTLSQN